MVFRGSKIKRDLQKWTFLHFDFYSTLVLDRVRDASTFCGIKDGVESGKKLLL